MQDIIAYLESAAGSGSFQRLLVRSRNRRETAVFFLALMELVRLNRVVAVQDNAFGSITLHLERKG